MHPVPTTSPTIVVKGHTVNLEPDYGQWIQLRDGFQVFTRTWAVPSGRPILGTVTCVHGLGEHIDRYQHFFPKFAEAGFQVNAFDQRGFGRTGLKYGIKNLGFTYGMDVALDDIKEFIERNTIKDIPRFLYGQSMGGLLVLQFLIKHGATVPLSGVISSAPAIQAKAEVKPSPIAVAFLRATLFLTKNWLIIDNPVDARGLTHDEGVVSAYTVDPLVHPRISANHANSILQAGSAIDSMTPDGVNQAFPHRVPILLVHGSKDPITDPAASTNFANKAVSGGSVSVTLTVYNDMLHEIHNEPQVKDKLAEQLIGWLKQHQQAT